MGADLQNKQGTLGIQGGLGVQGDTYFATNPATTVGIGTMSPAETLEVVGNVQAVAYYHSSDERRKDNMQVIGSSIGKIRQINGVTCDWKNNGKSSIGVIAQDVEKVFPEAVKTNTVTGMKTVEYAALVAPLIEAVKELNTKVESQQAEIESLKQMIK